MSLAGGSVIGCLRFLPTPENATLENATLENATPENVPPGGEMRWSASAF